MDHTTTAPLPRRLAAWLAAAAALLLPVAALAQETVCARVKIEIKQELTLERQAFDAEMKINNTTDSGVIENVSVVVKVTDEAGTPVAITDNPNDTSAKFFIRLSGKQNIGDVDGSGTVNPKTTSVINWLLIPAPGSAGNSPLGKKYLVGATLKYRFGGEDTVLEISPDVITVKPLPLLTLDYFLQQDVIGDDPLTPEIEAVEPATLGVRVKNNGYAAAKNLKIDSAQPKIVENNQGLLINFTLTGSYVNDAPAQNTLLLNFGDIAAGTSKTGRWLLETTLAGKFTEFTAKFSHADELGGTLTSLLQATNAHLLIRDVRVDLPGRDMVRDFLAQDGDVVRIYESDGPDTLVTDRSAVAQMTAGTNPAGNASYRITFPATSGFAWLKLPDPFNGTKALGQVQRSDAKQLLPENAWLSKTRNLEAKRWEYWVNIFDVNTTGSYDTEFKAPLPTATPPQLQFIPDHTVKEEQQVSFLVEASSAAGLPLLISAAPLPAGARLLPQAADPQAPTLARALFDWTPPKGSAGTYLITYTANDGTLSGTRSARIKVESSTPPPGPGTPTIDTPASGGQVTSLRPSLAVQASTNPADPSTQLQFELYRDEAMTQLVESALVAKAPPLPGNGGGSVPQPTRWQPAADLNDNTTYWWRARAYDGTQMYSTWVNGRFFVNLFNDAPDSFNLTSPSPNAEVSLLQPVLSWTNSADKDGDALTYAVAVYRNAALTELVTQGADLPGDAGGTSSWTVAVPLSNHVTYYWRVTARDALGAQTASLARPFLVNTGNTAPSVPVIQSPLPGSQSAVSPTLLGIQNSSDAENDLLTYVFEIDTVNTFDSGDKRSSGQVIQSAGAVTSWPAANLVENKHYYWRVKAQDGRAESAWAGGDFLFSAVNEAPPAPTVRNPGNGAWTPSLQPSLEANPVLDPEGEAVGYQFEVYRDAALSSKVIDGSSSNAGWIVPVALADKTTHWWRVRAVDPRDTASAWSAPSVLYVSTGPYQDPSIQVTAPATAVQPTLVDNRKLVTLRWEGTDPNIEPTIALYYGTSKTGFGGTLIVDGLRQVAGTQSGTYAWDVTGLPTGTYYVHAAIYDAKGIGRAYAAGSVVIAPAAQTGVITVAGDNLATNETGTARTFTVKLGRQPAADVVIPVASNNPREGTVSPPSFTFTPANWNSAQTATVTGRDDCVLDGAQTYQVVLGAAVSNDPNYIGLVGRPVNVTNADRGDNASGTSSPDIHVCGYSLVSIRQLAAKSYEYVIKVEFSNSGAPVTGVQAILSGMPSGFTAPDNQIQIGAIGTNETAKPADTVTFLAPRLLLNPPNSIKGWAVWSVTIQR
ncbi:hypothetical protein [Rhizobacter sp. SG703]|uniref:hypothetical protein n=1 Tax=Rhizobacter sp. SG703 TaxID=2587140 RepID=UPI001447E3B7|nr:hypothetical protein [Rhizobacter sp. SG703]NKI95404.1 hypothetical protein [Rhizobacter sp. SG703]